MKKYLVIALAAMGFAACAENVEPDVPTIKGEREQSYVAITLAADETSRATNGNEYYIGTDAERAVKSAHVFFFKNGAAFPVTFDGVTNGQRNFIQIDLDDLNENGTVSDMDNISDIKDEVLVIENYKGEYPNEMVVVLNWTPENKNYNLSQLQEAVTALGDETKGFVMSNAVYADKANTIVDAVKITEANIGKSDVEALANPVTVYVERVAAKVVYTAENSGKFNVGKKVNDTEIYAQIQSFELYNDYEESYLLKRINPNNWNTEANFGFTNWNDVDWFRSYWAESIDGAFPNNTFNWNTDNTVMGKSNYLGENTRAWTLAEDVRTKVIVKAKLVDAAGNTVEVVNWFGKDYIGEENLKKVVANTLKYTYFTSNDGKTFTGIDYNDLKCMPFTSTDPDGKYYAYQVYFQLDDSVVGKQWYKYNEATSSYVLYADNATLNTELKDGVQPALVYNDGMTYYSTAIQHLGSDGSTTEFGVVRNHVYKVNISKISGFGTPIYDPNQDFVTPEKPKDIETYVSAQINILSWRVVEDNYEI